MKIAFSAKKSGIFNKMDEQFARAEIFLIYNTETKGFRQIDNSSGRAASQGAGILAAELMVRNEVSVVVTEKCGPKAKQALDAADISVYTTKQKTVALALDEYLKAHSHTKQEI